MFDCTACAKKDDKGYCRQDTRLCFVKNKRMEVDFPVMNEVGAITGVERRYITKEDVIKRLIEFHRHVPNMLAYEVLNLPPMAIEGKKVCPVGLFDYETDFLTSLESAASEYHTLPYGDWQGNGYLDQPLYIIEAFDVCRSARAKYSNKKMNAMKENQKKGKKGS